MQVREQLENGQLRGSSANDNSAVAA